MNSIGAIDGTHVRLAHSPSPKIALSYLNRHSDYSMNCMAACDSRSVFTDVSIGWPGRAHDARVLYNGCLYQDWVKQQAQ